MKAKNIVVFALLTLVVVSTGCSSTQVIRTSDGAELASFGRGHTRQVFAKTHNPQSGESSWERKTATPERPVVNQTVMPVYPARAYVYPNVYYSQHTYGYRNGRRVILQRGGSSRRDYPPVGSGRRVRLIPNY